MRRNAVSIPSAGSNHTVSVRLLFVHAHMYRKLKPNGEVVNRGLNLGVYLEICSRVSLFLTSNNARLYSTLVLDKNIENC